MLSAAGLACEQVPKRSGARKKIDERGLVVVSPRPHSPIFFFAPLHLVACSQATSGSAQSVEREVAGSIPGTGPIPTFFALQTARPSRGSGRRLKNSVLN